MQAALYQGSRSRFTGNALEIREHSRSNLLTCGYHMGKGGEKCSAMIGPLGTVSSGLLTLSHRLVPRASNR